MTYRLGLPLIAQVFMFLQGVILVVCIVLQQI